MVLTPPSIFLIFFRLTSSFVARFGQPQARQTPTLEVFLGCRHVINLRVLGDGLDRVVYILPTHVVLYCVLLGHEHLLMGTCCGDILLDVLVEVLSCFFERVDTGLKSGRLQPLHILGG